MEGWLLKRSAVLKKWNRRYCRLIPGDCRLLYYIGEKDVTEHFPKGNIDLGNKVVEMVDDSERLPPFTISIKRANSRKDRILLRAESAAICSKWFAALRAAVNGELPPVVREVTLDKHDRAAESIFIPPEKIKPMILDIITADSELTFRGVRRALETEMGLDEGALYGVRDTLAGIMAELVEQNGLGIPRSFKLGSTSPPEMMNGRSPAGQHGSDDEDEFADADDGTSR